MKRLYESKSLIVMIILLVVFLLMTVYLTDTDTKKEKESKHVSMIVYGDDAERWENMREGALLVCEEKGADLNMLTMLSENDTAEQEEIIDREISGGADALIIAPCNSSKIKEYVSGKRLRIPVVYVETVESAFADINIATDDYEMGYKLGEEIVQNESDIVTIAIISENTERDCVALREKGLRDAIEGKVGKVINWSRDEYKANVNTRMFIQKEIVSEATDVIVAFDNTTTDALLDALENLNQTGKIYSISTSNKAVYNLYNQQIKSLEYPDEFSMGYLAAMHVLDSTYAKGKYGHRKIEYRMVRKENMYDKENQTLLFPFVD
jgi:ribose transport system substrate-binding protein